MKSRLVSVVCFLFIANQGNIEVVMGQRPREGSDVDKYLNTLQIIRRYGYPAESHVVETEDGYILELHRIPNEKYSRGSGKRHPIFIQHGIFGSSADFLLLGPEKALAFLLADQGYDVWLGNFRGNTYSRAHVTLTPSDKEFWNFTWHEGGVYDLPAQIDYIRNYTGSDKVFYIGYSMGTTMFFVLTSTRPEYQEKIEGAVLLAAVAYLNNTRSPVRLLVPFLDDFETLAEALVNGEVGVQSPLYRFLVTASCTLTNLERDICENILFFVTGYDPKELNQTLLPNLLYHIPAGTSSKSVTHFAQLVRSGKFQQYDYGKNNLRVYGRRSPPEYDLRAIRTPVYIYEGQNDLLSTLPDVRRSTSELQNSEVNVLEYPEFNHLDFLLANDVKTILYDKLFDLLSRIYSY